MSTLKIFAGQTILYGLSTIIARLLNFVLTPLYIYKFPANIYGIFTTMYSWAAMLNAFLAFGMETTFFRYLHKHENKREDVYSNSLAVILITSGIFITLTLSFAENLAIWMQDGAYSADRVLYIKYFAFILVADALCVIPFASLRAEGRAKRFGLVKLLNISIAIALNLFFIVFIPYLKDHNIIASDWLTSWHRDNWIGYVFLSNLIASIITLFILLPELLRIRIKVNWHMLVDMLVYSFPILIANFSFIINENLDKIFLAKLLPSPQNELNVGIYGAATKIAMFLSIFVQAFRLGAEPFFFSHAKEKNARQTYAVIMDYFIIAMVIVMLALVCNIDILKYFIKGNGAEQKALYWSGLSIVPVLLMGYVFLGIYMSLSIWYKLSDQTYYGLYISGAGAVITILFNYLFIPQYGYFASAWITLFTYFFMVILSYLLGQKKYPIPYHILKNISYISVAGCLSWISYAIFNSNIWIGNFLLIIFFLGTCILERKNLRNLLK